MRLNLNAAISLGNSTALVESGRSSAEPFPYENVQHDSFWWGVFSPWRRLHASWLVKPASHQGRLHASS